MKIGIMQPYFLPYLGYWQLINEVDKYVILDDVNFIVRGFINRNAILLNGSRHNFVLPVNKASQNKLIKDTYFYFQNKENEKLLKTIEQSYRKAPFYHETYDLLKKMFFYEDLNVAHFIGNSIKNICEYLNIETEILFSSEINKNNRLKSEDRIIEINRKLGSDTYINAIGGKELYSKNVFIEEGINLYFIKKDNIIYKQFDNDFVDNLSIIDVLMFNSKDKVKNLLTKFTLE